jgi:exodeoxyribonuclease VII small subunit
MPKAAAADAAKLSYEEASERLEEIVTQMEDGELALEDLLARYEEGAKLVTLCRKHLNAAERRLEMLRSQPAEGDDEQKAKLDESDVVSLDSKDTGETSSEAREPETAPSKEGRRKRQTSKNQSSPDPAPAGKGKTKGPSTDSAPAPNEAEAEADDDDELALF